MASPIKSKDSKPKKRKPRLSVKKSSYYGFDHKVVRKKLSGGLTFLNEFCVRDKDRPVAVYHAAKPNRRKGHKRYLLLWRELFTQTVYLSGMTAAQMKKERYQDALHCLKCNEVLFSMARHHVSTCSCRNAWIDGGKAYLHWGFKKKEKTRLVKLDLLTDKIVEIYKD